LLAVLLATTVSVGFVSNVFGAQMGSAEHSVLFISSYHPGFPTSFDQEKGLRAVLDQQSVRLDIEYMDAKRFYAEADLLGFHDYLQKKLKRLPPYDLVITGDDAALNFAEQHHSSLLAGLPVVFFGVNDVAYAQGFESNPEFTGITEEVSVADTVRLIQRLFGDSDPITVIVDGTDVGVSHRVQFEQEMQRIGFKRFRLLSMTEYSYEELQQELQKIHPPASVLLISAFLDRHGRVQEFSRLLRDIRTSTEAPVFHFWYHGVGRGVLGGKLLSHLHQAEMAATMALEILAGAAPSSIPVQRDSANQYLFDYAEMQRFGLERADMPHGSGFINEPDSLYYRYRPYLIAVGLLIGALLVTIAALLIRIRRRQNAERSMLQINQDLEEKIAARTLALDDARLEAERILRLRDSILDNSLVAIVLMKARRVEWINRYAEALFGYSRAEAVGRSSDFIYANQEDFERLGRDAPPVLMQGESYQAEFPYLRKDGTIFWGIISGKAINPKDLGEGALFIIMNISARKQAEDQLKKLNLKLEQQATTDHLTGISNRRHITGLIAAEIGRSNRYAEPFSVILLDVDFFKSINDSFGHSAGDLVLAEIARLLQQTCREVDTVARWGGEEFLLLCPATAVGDAVRLAELLRERIEQHDFKLPCTVTASFGVAGHAQGQALEAVLKAADAALYRAKETRNCVQSISN
jgi:diguanylate cyclase (GGDEF)-like protein/PAS domain S-box-containing protein